MPVPLSTALLTFGAVLTTVNDTAGVIVAGVGLLVELSLFYSAGIDGR